MTDQTSAESLSTAVIRAVAAREDVKPTDLEETLYQRINPNALNLLFEDTKDSVTFEYHGYIVTVDSEGRVELADAHRS